jgi:ankyrin repeat protein
MEVTSMIFSTYFIERNIVDLNIEDKNGWTPLHHAVRNNASGSIEFLLDHGVDDVRLNKQHEAAIHLGVIHNQLNALKVCFLIRIIFLEGLNA